MTNEEIAVTLTEHGQHIKSNAALDAQLTDTQLALCDVYEMMGG